MAPESGREIGFTFGTLARAGSAQGRGLPALTASVSPEAPFGIEAAARPAAKGKFLFLGDQKHHARGVTYGTFRPRSDGHEYPVEEVVEQDFALMAANGINTVRTYTVPPRWLLDAALRHGLHVLVGLAVERYVGYLADRKGGPGVDELVSEGVRACAGHPAVLAYALANEIPAPIVRWHGRRRVERYLERLFRAAKAADPEALVTYVNYPTTEYLQLPFLDLVCFNTYLESRDRFEAYLARLQNLAGDRPLLLTEIGLDAVRNGEAAQADTLEWQVRAAFASGCAGVCVYAWTDEWHRGGEDVQDWGFGLTRRDRSAKPALASVRRAFAEVPVQPGLRWPRISVVVCSFNGARTIRDCLGALEKLDYPDYEVIVVNDGSQDATPSIAAEYGCRLISTENGGLSSARNTGMQGATGEIVAYIDDDAYPDVHWLTHLASSFMNTSHAAVGGPNISPPDAGRVAQCIANAPGNPAHVLLSDREAEHIPGCNMAIRKACLEAIGGFDVRFRTAGDDVDVCWRLRQRGWTIGFSPGAMVWHHRRGSLRAFWRQQVGYGRAEAMLERKWPEKYNAAGHLSWSGRVYGNGMVHLLGRRSRIYFGTWGCAPFQPLLDPTPGTLSTLVSVPEWYVVVLVLATLSALGAFLRPLLLGLPLLGVALGLPVLQAWASARSAWFPSAARSSRLGVLGLRMLTAFLHLFQPAARLRGRLGLGLTPWRRRGAGFAFPRTRAFKLWTEHWRAPEERLRNIDEALRSIGGVVRRGDGYDAWDLEVRGGMLGSGRLIMAVEEHGGGRQLVRLRAWPISSDAALALSLGFVVLGAGAAAKGALLVGAIFGAAALLCLARTLHECARAMGTVLHALGSLGIGEAATKGSAYTDLSLYSRLLREARPWWPHVAGIFALSLLSTPLGLLAPLPMMVVVDSVIGSHPVPGLLGRLLPSAISSGSLLTLMVGLLVAVTLASQLQEVGVALLRLYAGEKLVLAFRSRLFAQLQRLSLSYHDSQGISESVYRIQYDAQSIQNIVIEGIASFLSAALTLACMLVITARLDWQLALVALAITPALLVLMRAYRLRLRSHAREVKRLEASALSVVQEVLSSIRVVRAFGQEEREQERFVSHSSASLRARLRLALVENGFALLVALTTVAGTAAVLWIGAGHVRSGSLTLGTLLLVMAYLAKLYEPLKTISRKTASLQSHLASAERAFSILDRAPDVAERPGAKQLVRAAGALAFREVSFAYEGERPVLRDVSFEIEPGTRMAITGATGAGKTTLVGLLTRFYDPAAGQVLLDGVDLRDYRVADLREQFAIVLQEPVLFSTTIAENITYGRPGASESEVVAAARAAGAHDFIVGLPGGYGAQVGERGMRLSGGERQRIALARAFLKDAPILILDEPTSSVDAATEGKVLEALARLVLGRTVLLIAHRPSLLGSCDVRLHLEEGRLVEVPPPPSALAVAGRPEA